MNALTPAATLTGAQAGMLRVRATGKISGAAVNIENLRKAMAKGDAELTHTLAVKIAEQIDAATAHLVEFNGGSVDRDIVRNAAAGAAVAISYGTARPEAFATVAVAV